MVLINGVKYACERCIRGHRVTTCTHTDQPLMMIKPKGRPSTQCPHCKEQRRVRNSHVNCNCSKRINSKVQHDPSCPCHVAGECSCCSKSKKSSKKKDKEDPAAAAALSTSAKRKSSKKSADREIKPILDDEISPSARTATPASLLSPASSGMNQPLEINMDLKNLSNLPDDISSQPLDKNQNNQTLYSNEDSTNGSSQQPFSNDRDSLNSLLQSWDMSSPPMGNSESLASLLSESSINHSNNYSASNNNNHNNTGYSSKYIKRQIGLDPLQNFRSSSSIKPQQHHHQQPHSQATHAKQQQHQQHQLHLQQQRGLGEISIPVEEYIKPLNKMNVHFNNFLTNLSDSSPIDPPISSPNNSISPGQISNVDLNMANFSSNNPNANSVINNNNNINNNSNNNNNNHIMSPNHVNFNTNNFNALNNGSSNLNSNHIDVNNNGSSFAHANNKMSALYNNVLPTPGNGLLDIFEDNVPTHKIYQNSHNASNASVRDSHDNEPDSLFPLFPLIGPSYSQCAQSVASSVHDDDGSMYFNKNTSNYNHNNVNIDNDSSALVDGNNTTHHNGAKLSQTNLHNFNMRPSSSMNSLSQNQHSQQNLLQQAAFNQAVSLSNNTQQYQAPLYRDSTGSSSHSTNSHQSFHSTHSLQSSGHGHYQHHHHGGSHGHSHQSHFQPYPSPQPRRSSSFLSVSSAHTIASSTGSPVSIAERPKLLTAESSDSIHAFTGPQLSNAKTNTTLMDDIYQTKTYTDSQSIATKRASMSGPSTHNQPQANDNSTEINLNDDTNFNANQNLDNFNSHEDYIENMGQLDPNLDMSLIGTVPLTSSMFMLGNNNANKNDASNSNRQQQLSNSYPIDQYDEQLFESLLQNNI